MFQFLVWDSLVSAVSGFKERGKTMKFEDPSIFEAWKREVRHQGTKIKKSLSQKEEVVKTGSSGFGFQTIQFSQNR
jgi:hypothetical protein